MMLRKKVLIYQIARERYIKLIVFKMHNFILMSYIYLKH